jgi:hypothetical protein
LQHVRKAGTLVDLDDKDTACSRVLRQRAVQVVAIVFPVGGARLIWWGFQHRNDPARYFWGWYHLHWFDGVADGAILCIFGWIAIRQAFLKK